MTDDELRDERLGAALRELPVPEHREGFWDDLTRNLRGGPMRQGRGGERKTRVPLWSLLVVLVAIVAIVAVLLVVFPRGRPADDAPRQQPRVIDHIARPA